MCGTLFGMAEQIAPAELTRKDTLSTCALKIVCYNADTRRNNLSHKGLPVNRARLFRKLRSICLIAAVLSLGLPELSAAQTAKKPAAAKKSTAKTTYSARQARARRA